MQHRGEIMQNKDSIHSVLKLNNLVFDKIEFKRMGFQNDNEIDLEIQSNISQRQGIDIYRITLVLNGNKPDEYSFEISLTGFFTIEDSQDITQELKSDLVSKNAIAILMPYLRSEVSLLTAQPGMDCVVLPAFNINKMLEEQNGY